MFDSTLKGRGGGVRADSGPSSSGRYGGTAALAGGSFNSNFNTHRREWAVMMKAKDREGGGTEVKEEVSLLQSFFCICDELLDPPHREKVGIIHRSSSMELATHAGNRGTGPETARAEAGAAGNTSIRVVINPAGSLLAVRPCPPMTAVLSSTKSGPAGEMQA